jgi:hypothetical protein
MVSLADESGECIPEEPLHEGGNPIKLICKVFPHPGVRLACKQILGLIERRRRNDYVICDRDNRDYGPSRDEIFGRDWEVPEEITRTA